MYTNVSKIATLLSIAGLVFCVDAHWANAGSSGTDSVSCGSSGLTWNAPNGYVVTNRSDGDIRAVMDGIGESRTHSMMSHGTINWVSHSTMRSPGTTGWPDYCSTPVKPNDIARGWPGFSQVNNSAIYQFLYEHGAPVYVRHQSGGTAGVTTADWLWSSSNYHRYDSQQGTGYLYQIWDAANANDQPYLFYQYKNEQGKTAGGDGSRYDGGVCSTQIAWACKKSGACSTSIARYTYSNAKVVGAGDNLYSSIDNSCDDGLGFWGGLGASITCFEGICDDAARQVRACFLGDWGCDTDSDSLWNSVKNNNEVAYAFSPDDLLGWSGHAYTGSTVGPWAPYMYSTTTWSAGGSTYGCWF